jgi:prepilin-type N-terminal cleavage/methylation domain-containing protein/prepilin-type processing-associated H-X9-DG protein
VTNERSRSGTTMIEVLVALSIIGLLIAILVPAVQSAREASRRGQCQSRLKEMALALNSFEATRTEFPSALALLPQEGPPTSDRFYAPHAFLLPYLDQTPLFSRLDLQGRQLFVGDPSLLGALKNTMIDAFQCPSDLGISGTNYRVCMGPGPYATASSLTPGGGLGAFAAGKVLRPADFRDGMSNTIALCEKLKSPGTRGTYTPEMFWYSGVADLVGFPFPAIDEVVSICDSLNGQPADFFPFAGRSWLLAAYEYTWYNHSVTPNGTAPDCSIESRSATSTSGGVFKASSHHSGGVNCAFMDGHIRFISNSVDLRVWRGLATRAGGEPLGGDSF